MKEIKRYDIIAYGDGWAYYDEEIINDGEWVKYLDHKAVVESKDKTIFTLTDISENKTKYICELEHNKKTMQKRIEELDKLYNLSNQKGNSQVDTILKLEAENIKLKELMNGTDDRYYCTEHGYLEGAEVTFEELCEYCKRPVSHGITKFDN